MIRTNNSYRYYDTTHSRSNHRQASSSIRIVVSKSIRLPKLLRLFIVVVAVVVVVVTVKVDTTIVNAFQISQLFPLSSALSLSCVRVVVPSTSSCKTTIRTTLSSSRKQQQQQHQSLTFVVKSRRTRVSTGTTTTTTTNVICRAKSTSEEENDDNDFSNNDNSNNKSNEIGDDNKNVAQQQQYDATTGSSSMPKPISSSIPSLTSSISSSTTSSSSIGSNPSSEQQQQQSQSQQQESQQQSLNLYEQIFNSVVVGLAQLSLQDYEWRINIFKKNEAERQMEQSLARMMGENATYVRPMDAPEKGLLGTWEQRTVQWLVDVIEEERIRAQQIIARSGKLIRPMAIEATSTSKSSSTRSSISASTLQQPQQSQQQQAPPQLILPDEQQQLGPLGRIERSVVEFWTQVRQSEVYRVEANVIRPKDVSPRGPLGELEYQIVQYWNELRSSELLRYQLQQQRSNQNKKYEIVRPIDVPGPLGEIELLVGEIVIAEQKRVTQGGVLQRPKDARYRGPIGNAEYQAVSTMEQLNAEEMERFRNIQKSIVNTIQQQQRPMESNDPNNVLGIIERIVVGIIRGPIILYSIFERVKELLFDTVSLNTYDQQVLASVRQQQQQQQSTKDGKLENYLDDDDDDNEYDDDDNNEARDRRTNSKDKKNKRSPPSPNNNNNNDDDILQ